MRPIWLSGAVLLVKRDYAVCGCCLFCNSLFVHRYESRTGCMVRSTPRTIKCDSLTMLWLDGGACDGCVQSGCVCIKRAFVPLRNSDATHASYLPGDEQTESPRRRQGEQNERYQYPYTVHTCTPAREKTKTTTITDVQSRVVHKCYVIESTAIYQPLGS